MNLYSDAENGAKEKIGTGFFTIAENLPVHSELQFTFRLTEDENMSVKVRVASTGKIHNINYSRGSLDSHCFEAIQSSFDRVMGDPNISDSQKNGFIDKLQKVIESIQVGGHSADSKEWQNIENSVQTATTSATTKEEGTDVNVIIAKILLDNFGRFMSSEHKDAMRRELTNYEDATNSMQKNEIAGRLGELNDYNTPRFSDSHKDGGMRKNRYLCGKEENQNGKTIEIHSSFQGQGRRGSPQGNRTAGDAGQKVWRGTLENHGMEERAA